MTNIKNKWALVTGSSRGIGKLIATALAEQGCQVILHARSLKATQALQEELTAKGHTVFAVAAELTDEAQIADMIAQVKLITQNQLSILYNNAAIMRPHRPIFEPTYEDYRQSFMVNSIAPAKITDAFLPDMLQQNWGRIVLVTSGIQNEPQLMPYSCSKAALDRYVRDMIPTLENTNVLMNLLDPGWVQTDLGGPYAPNQPEAVIPGALVPVFLSKEDGSGQLYLAQTPVQ